MGEEAFEGDSKGEGIRAFQGERVTYISKSIKEETRSLILIYRDYHIGENRAHLEKVGLL